MSWKHNKSRVLGVRKMRWDGLWHILYLTSSKTDPQAPREIYDRVRKETADNVLKNMIRWRKLNIP